jgi:hypothetical protein
MHHGMCRRLLHLQATTCQQACQPVCLLRTIRLKCAGWRSTAVCKRDLVLQDCILIVCHTLQRHVMSLLWGLLQACLSASDA